MIYLKKVLFDIHVHMGQYFDDYYTPPRVLRTLKCAGITHFAYSSTSNVVTDEMRKSSFFIPPPFTFPARFTI